MTMKVTYYRQNQDQNSSVVAYLGLYLENIDLYLSKLRYIRKRDGGFFISFPSEKYTDKEGKGAYQNYCWFGKKFGDSFQKKAHDVINAYIEENQHKIQEQEQSQKPAQQTQSFDNYSSEQDAELPF